MIIHPTARGAHDTLANVVAGDDARQHIEAGIIPFIVDRNTTGSSWWLSQRRAV